MKILTTYIAADEGTALVNGHDVASDQKAVQLSITGTQSVVFGFVCVREYLALMPISIKLPNLVSKKYYK
jgi:ABC-2 type transport system ATP-binding protein